MTDSSYIADSFRLDADIAEPIAIIGTACRFSGNASSHDGLWQLLSKGMTSWASNARNRFKLESFWHPHAQLSGSVNSRGLHLLQQDPAVFDNDFFGISGVEAKAIDPNQRLMLEVAYEAFENAGISLESLEGSSTGVICSVPYLDYDHIQGRDAEVSPLYRFTGTGSNILANRVSYVFDLRGPSMTVDTACSSTLVALHEACRALRAGDADQILVGGSNLILDPDKLTQISSMQFLSPHGRCYAFDSRASGYGRGEGVAAVLLKPLTAAIQSGDTIRAVIRGSAVGSDGKTHGITLPSPMAQYDTIRKAYQSAGLDPGETLYVEAHGTGTKAGDGCEIEAFSNAFCKSRPNKLIVGSVKANLGHTEGVAGLAGLIKTIMMMEKGVILPNPSFTSANPSLELEARNIEIPTKLIKWPDGTVRRVSINGTGYGGVNAHVIVEAWPRMNHLGGCLAAERPTPHGDSAPQPHILVWSHQREDGLVKMASTWKRFIMAAQAAKQCLRLDDIAFTLGSRRSHLVHRAAIVASGMQQLLEGIRKIELGSVRPVKALTNQTLCFVFTGQGAQWAQMGADLVSTFAVFSQSLHRSETELLRLGATWRLTEELKKPEATTRINSAELAQPCCTAVQVALVDLLASWNVRPGMVCGHSSGEIAAAYAAGAITDAEAVKVAFFRGRAAEALRKHKHYVKGSMLAVGLSETDVQAYLGNFRDAVSVACVNSPSGVTLSGDATAIDQLTTVLDSAAVFNRKLAVDVAYHSHHMVLVKDYYHSAINGVKPQLIRSEVRMVSSVTGHEVKGSELDADYWTRNLVSQVRFSDALAGLVRPRKTGIAITQPSVMVEIGPHAALRGPTNQTFKSLPLSHSIHYASCLRRKESSKTTCLQLAAELFTHGFPVDLSLINNPESKYRRVVTDLPSYNWHHENVHWNESRRSAVYRTRKFPRHELLGNATADSISAEPSWRVYIKLSELPWVRGHCIDGQIVFAASGFISMTLEAMKRHCQTTGRSWRRKTVQLKDVVIDRPLLIPDDDFGAEVFTLLRPYSNASRQSSSRWYEFRIYSVSKNNESTEHCRGLVAVSESLRKLAATTTLFAQGVGKGAGDEGKGEEAAQGWNELEMRQMYEDLHSVGNEYSGCFASLSKVSSRPWGTKCEMTVPNVLETMPSKYQQPHCLHPTTLEACVQACLPGLQAADCINGAQVVTGFDEVHISTDMNLRPGQILSITTQTAPHGLRHHSGDFVVAQLDEEPRTIIHVKGIKYSSLGTYGVRDARSAAMAQVPLCYQVEWVMDPSATSGSIVESYCREGLDDDQDKMHSQNAMMSLPGGVRDGPSPEDPCLKRCSMQLARYLKLLQLKVPDIRILEVGGGTSMALTLLESLHSKQQQYPSLRWTHVLDKVEMPGTPEAQERLEKLRPFYELKHLDMRQCPSQQGFELSSFDVIVTCNIAQMTQDVRVSLTNLKKLLKPSGQIAMVELVKPSPRWGLTKELNTSQWHEELSQTGFAGVTLEMRDYDAEEKHEASVMMSHIAVPTACAITTNATSRPDFQRIAVIAKESDEATAAVARDCFQAHYPDCEVTLHSPSSAAKAKATHVIMLELSSDLLLAPSACEWANIRDAVCRAKAVLWVTRGARATSAEPQRGLVEGMCRSLRWEKPHLRFCMVDLDAGSDKPAEAAFQIMRVYEHYLGPNAPVHSSSEGEIAVRDGRVMVCRLMENKVANEWLEDSFSNHHPREMSLDVSRSLGLRIRSAGMLDTLYWADDAVHCQVPRPSQIRIRLDNVALNFKDVMTAMGQLEGQSTLLIEGSGTVLEVGDGSKSRFAVGDKVCFFGPDGLATVCNLEVDHACLVPRGMSMETAASVPVAYATALYALRDVGRLEPGESVLIHSGAGAVGQAAIALAQFLGAGNIFVTAGSAERRDFVRDKFGISARHILSSRNVDFRDEILELTGGRGVDIVVNSLSGDMLAASLGCLASFGRFVEIGKKDVLCNGRLEMSYLEKNITFSTVDLTLIARERPRRLNKLLRACLKLVHERNVEAITPVSSAHVADIEKHLRAMQAGEHIGKLVLKVDASRPIRVQPAKPGPVKLREDASYVVAGSSRGLHKDVVRHLATLGAKRTILLSGSGIEDAGMEEFVNEVGAMGSEVVVVRGSLRDKSSVGKLREASRGMPIRGVIQGVTPQQSTLTEFMTHTQWCQANTAQATLDLFTELGQELDFFILLGSAAAVIGTSGQSSYCAGNTFLDAFARHQSSLGRPVRAIDVGLVHDEVGSFESADVVSKLSSHGVQAHGKAELFALIDHAIQQPIAETVAQAQIVCGIRRDWDTRDRSDARFSHVSSRSSPQTCDEGSNKDNADMDVPSALQAASTRAAAVEAAYAGMRQKLARLLGMSAKEIQADRSVASYGVDSLISVELRNWVAGHLRSHVQTLELMSGMEMKQLAEVVAKRSRLVRVGIFD